MESREIMSRGCIALKEGQTDAILAAFPDQNMRRNTTLFKFGVWSGLRISDLLKLSISDFIHNGVWLDELAVKEKKGNKIRRIAIGEEFAMCIKEFISDRINNEFTMNDDYVFCKRNGKKIGYEAFLKVVKDAGRIIGLPVGGGLVGTHCMRKTFAREFLNDLLDSGMTISEAVMVLQNAMGHSSIASTTSYMGWDDDKVEEFMLQHGGKKLGR